MKALVPTAQLPAELTELRQWVTWQFEERDGKRTKVPYQPGRTSRASTTNSRTWGSYGDALEATEVDGIGFVFTADDPFCGVDLDACVDEGAVHPDALAIVHSLDSYTELSVSGTGVHVIVRAAIPEGEKLKTRKTPWGGMFETYDRGRYFCMTGRQL